MLNEKTVNANLKIISKKLKENNFLLNKKLLKLIFIKKKKILEKINKINKKQKRKNIENFFCKKFLKMYKNFFTKIKNKIKNIMLNIPNLKHKSVLKTDEIIKEIKFKKIYNKKQKNHIEIGKQIGLNLKIGKNISGNKSSLISNPILYLYKAITKFIIIKHIKEHNYKEIKVPYITNYENIINSGQLPKFIKNIFFINKNKYLISTGEISIINTIKNKKIKSKYLPIKIFSKTECFRKEKSYGKKNKGLIRQNQFEKIELINFVDQKNSYNYLKEIVKINEKFLKKLKLNYRIIILSKKNTGFTSSKTIDIEIWMPSLNNFCEISSCSNTENYQSERTNFKYTNKEKTKYLHILNGSSLPLGRILASIIENYQYKKKYLIIPRILRKYMNKKRFLKIK